MFSSTALRVNWTFEVWIDFFKTLSKIKCVNRHLGHWRCCSTGTRYTSKISSTKDKRDGNASKPWKIRNKTATHYRKQRRLRSFELLENGIVVKFSANGAEYVVQSIQQLKDLVRKILN